MMQTVKGVYRDGEVELLELPSDVVEGEVLVTFVSEQALDNLEPETVSDAPRKIYRGMLSSGGRKSTEEDFKSAEFYGDSGDNLDWS